MMAKPKSKGHAPVKVAAKNALRVKRKASSKRRRLSRKEARRQKVIEAKLKGTSSLLHPHASPESDEDLDDIIEMTDAEYLPRAADLSKMPNTSSLKEREEGGSSVEVAYEGEKEKKNSRVKHLLPIKTAAGFVSRTNVDEDDDHVSGVDGSVNDDVNEEDDGLTPEERREQQAAVEAELRTKIGNWCALLVEDPELNVDHLRHVLNVLNDKRAVTANLQLLAVLSLREVFLDIIPDYVIREHDVEKRKVKKDLIKLWKFENAILSAYKGYLLKLETFAGFLKQHTGHNTPAAPHLRDSFRLAVASVRSMRDLLLRHPHFNFAGNLIKMVVNLSAHAHPEIGPPCIRTLTSLFRQDNVGEVSLQAVKHLYAMAKRKNYQLPSRIFDPLLALRIQHVKTEEEVLAEMQRHLIEKKSIKKMSRKEKKRKIEQERVNKDLELAAAEESAEKKQKFQTETLNVVFTIYFRMLKSRPNPRLLSVCLEGLAKYSHLINLDFFPDLINVLHNLASKALAEDVSDDELDSIDDENSDSGFCEESGHAEVKRLSPWQALHCVKTAFSVVSGQGSVLAIEPIRFFGLLYNALVSVNAGTSAKDQTTAVEALVVALVERRKTLSSSRCLAFCKRLLTMALHQTHPVALAYLNVCRILMMTHKSTSSLVDLTEEGPVGRGQFNPEAKDPEHSMAQTAVAWELATLRRHYNPIVSKYADHVAHGCPPSGPGNLAPELTKLDVLEILDEFSMGDGIRFRPPVSVPPLLEDRPLIHKHHEWRDQTLRESAGSLLKCKYEFNLKF